MIFILYYVVEFAHFYFKPKYTQICFWSALSHCWSDLLLPCNNAEDFAKTFKSIEDVKLFYKKDEAKEKEFYASMPYKKKDIL